MKKDVIKSLIAIKQSEIPFDVIERDIKLPINRKKIITVPGVRRCGKSTLMEIAINDLVREGVSSKNILNAFRTYLKLLLPVVIMEYVTTSLFSASVF